MRLGNFHRFGNVMRFQKCDCDQLSVIGVPGGATFALRLKLVDLRVQQPGVEFVTFAVLAQGPFPHFLRTAFLILLGELRWVLSKNKGEMFHNGPFHVRLSAVYSSNTLATEVLLL
jgi:hypothetical protein